MPYSVKLPANRKKEGWKAKIREKERLEPPHLTVQCGLREWRIALRDWAFLVPPGGGWADIPSDVREAIEADVENIKSEWNRKYPSNPVGDDDDD